MKKARQIVRSIKTLLLVWGMILGTVVGMSQPLSFLSCNVFPILENDLKVSWLEKHLKAGELEFDTWLILRQANSPLANTQEGYEAFLKALRGNDELLKFFSEDVKRVEAWEVLISDEVLRNEVGNLIKIDDYLGYNPNRADDLASEFGNSKDKLNFVNGFIGGPLHKLELEQLNRLRNIQQLHSGVLNQEQLAELNKLTTQLGNFQYPKYLAPNINNLKVSLTNVLPEFPQSIISRFFKGRFKVEGNEIVGFKDGDYDFVLMADGELRIGHGHAHLSDSAMNLPAAGGITIFNNKIVKITGNTGHYKPTETEVKLITKYFQDIGLF